MNKDVSSKLIHPHDGPSSGPVPAGIRLRLKVAGNAFRATGENGEGSGTSSLRPRSSRLATSTGTCQDSKRKRRTLTQEPAIIDRKPFTAGREHEPTGTATESERKQYATPLGCRLKEYNLIDLPTQETSRSTGLLKRMMKKRHFGFPGPVATSTG